MKAQTKFALLSLAIALFSSTSASAVTLKCHAANGMLDTNQIGIGPVGAADLLCKAQDQAGKQVYDGYYRVKWAKLGVALHIAMTDPTIECESGDDDPAGTYLIAGISGNVLIGGTKQLARGLNKRCKVKGVSLGAGAEIGAGLMRIFRLPTKN